MHKSIFLLILTVLLSASAYSQEVLTLQKAIEIGLENNLQIKIGNNTQKIAENNYTIGNAGFLPTLDLEGNYAINNNLRFEGTSSSDSTFVRTNIQSNSLGVNAVFNWVLFDGTKMFVTYDKLERLREQSRWDSKVVVENTLVQILKAYYTVINENSQLSILKNTLELSQERVDIARESYEIGGASKAEHLAAQVDFNADQSAFIAQKGTLADAKVQLNVLLAREAYTQFDVEDSLIQVDADFDIASLREKIAQENYQIASSKIGVQIADMERQEIKTELLPQVALNANTGYGQSNNPIGFIRSSQSTSLNFGLSATWRIFDGFNRNRRIQNAIITQENQAVALDQLQNELLGQLETVYVSYQNRLELIDLELKNVEIARENVEIALVRYKEGRSNPIAMREAQLNAMEAEGRLLTALYEAKLAEIDIMNLSGTAISEE